MHPRTTRALAVCGLAASLGLSGCASESSTSAATSATASPAPATSTAPTASRKSPVRRSRRDQLLHGAVSRRSPRASLLYSTASNEVVQPQPTPGSCHAVGSGLYSRPDPSCTPGGLNPAVTQATIDQTICVDGWTASIRPPESITEPEKAASIGAYGDAGPLGDYEYDHFVPLELGGATNDPRNLWPEPGASPNPKDAVEDDLRSEVCSGRLTLAEAQHEIVNNWVLLARPTGAVRAPTGSATCSLSALYNSRYSDYDVYVHSNQPDLSVTVTDSAGHSKTWHTDASGHADVYFNAGGQEPGAPITAQVGRANCATTL